MFCRGLREGASRRSRVAGGLTAVASNSIPPPITDRGPVDYTLKCTELLGRVWGSYRDFSDLGTS